MRSSPYRPPRRHDGSTTGPIDAAALLARLRRERERAGRAFIAPLTVPHLELRTRPRRHAPTVTYTRDGRRHLAAVMVLAALLLALTVAVSTWVELNGPADGWARWMQRAPGATVQPAYAPVRTVPVGAP